jgi:hypothetical protein
VDHPGLLSSIGEVRRSFLEACSVYSAHFLLLVLQTLLGILERLYITIVHPAVRERCLTAITKILYFSTPEMLTESMKVYTHPPP